MCRGRTTPARDDDAEKVLKLHKGKKELQNEFGHLLSTLHTTCVYHCHLTVPRLHLYLYLHLYLS